MSRTHHLPDEQVHFTWDAGNEPVLGIDSGDTVVVWTRDVSDNQISPESDVSVIAGLDWDRVYPLNGPIAVRGAAPGDTLAIEVLDIHTQGWGWTAILPGLGLLPGRRTCGSSTSRTATLRTCARTSRSRSSPSLGRWGCVRPARRRSR
jgi:acetamidase/formamidase